MKSDLEPWAKYGGTWEFVSGDPTIWSKAYDKEINSFLIEVTRQNNKSDYIYGISIDGMGSGGWSYSTDLAWWYGFEGASEGFLYTNLNYADYYLTMTPSGTFLLTRTEDHGNTVQGTAEYKKK